MVKRAFPGQDWSPPRAQEWNDIGEATEIFQRHQRTRDAAQLKQWILPTDWVFCTNDSGGDRRAGEVLECGSYLLNDFDPMSLWFSGGPPTDPVRQSTHGVLRVAVADGKMERVQVSGVVRAYVNVTDASHNFCDAAVGAFVLKSNNRGPHKIVYKPSGTGELTCAVLLYCGELAEIVAECYALTDHCPDDEGGSGTGSEGQEVSVYGFKILPFCDEVDPPPKVTNPKNHRWPAGSLLTVIRKECPDTDVEWQVVDVELRKICMVNGIKRRFNQGSTDSGAIIFGSVPIGGEWCPADEPDTACELITFGPCAGSVTADDLTWEVLIGVDCCDVEEGGGSGT